MTSRMPAALRWLGTGTLLLGGAALLGACARYQPLPLPTRSDLVASPVALTVDSSKLVLPGIRVHRFDPTDGLDMTEVATLAVLNNPSLKAQRRRRGIARAQLFAAGLLPDPQVSSSFDHPTTDALGLVNAWALGLGYDLLPLITRSTRIDAAAAATRQVDLDLMWQEWQVAQQARILFVRYLSEEPRLALLRRTSQLYRQRYRLASKALAEGNLTLEVAGTDLAALIDTFSQVNRLEQTHNETRHDLNLLLGLKPGSELTLQPLPPSTLPDPAVVRTQLKTIADRRPDLLALKAGYDSQEAKVRQAILEQFPSLVLGVNRARDTGAVNTTGFGVSLTLPVFSANRGAIAVARATREKMRAEYRARLAKTEIDVDRLLRLQGLIAEQQKKLADYLPELKRMVDRARPAYERRDIDALIFFNMETTWINKRLEQLTLAQSQWESRIALETLLAAPAQDSSNEPSSEPGNNPGSEPPPSGPKN